MDVSRGALRRSRSFNDATTCAQISLDSRFPLEANQGIGDMGATPAIRTEGLCKRYGDVEALHDLHLEIAEGPRDSDIREALAAWERSNSN